MALVATTRIWPQLPAELSERIANFLRPNDIACSLRLVNKAAAAQFRGPQHTTIGLSQPVPSHAFARHWGAPGATRQFSYKQRLRLLCLTAASGSIPNMEVALAAAGCLPTTEVFQAAAAAGQRAMCEWLLQRGCPHYGALKAAAEAGQRDMCEWLLGQGDSFVDPSALKAAARGGHVGLMEWLMRTLRETFGLPANRPSRAWRLVRVAEGCDLATLQRLHSEWLEAPQEGDDGRGQEQGLRRSWEPRLLAAAAHSRTPDWRAKVEWLEGLGCEKTKDASTAAAACPDAVERLTWLRGRGYPVSRDAAEAAARAGNLAAVQYLHAEGVEMDYANLWEAARNGHLSVVAWRAQAPGVAAQLGKHLFDAAARSGSLELMAWLRERGCPWGMFTFYEATQAGNEAALEWLAEQGCPMGDDGEPYVVAFRNGDPATLRCLARLGCPCCLPEEVAWQVLDNTNPVMLRALLVAG